ncbi:hypothetical protein ACTXT7_003404 [Hymenolepis weldensis]
MVEQASILTETNLKAKKRLLNSESCCLNNGIDKSIVKENFEVSSNIYSSYLGSFSCNEFAQKQDGYI